MRLNSTLLAVAFISLSASAAFALGGISRHASPERQERDARVKAGDAASDALDATNAWERLMDSTAVDDLYQVNSVRKENRPAFLEAIGKYSKRLEDVWSALREYSRAAQSGDDAISALADSKTIENARLELAAVVKDSDPATLFTEETLARLSASQFSTRDILVTRKDWGGEKKIEQELREREEREKAAELSKELPGKIQHGFDDLKRQMGE